MNINLDVALNATAGGVADASVIDELQKALTAGYGTDVSQLTGGSALRIQSLDKTMKSTIQENEHFVLFNALAKSGAGATVDEWTERTDVGSFPGGSTNSETGVISQAQGNYKRRVGLVKYLMTQAQVSLVATLGNNIEAAKAVEAQAAALRLLTDAEYLSFEGDSTVVPTEFDGIAAQMYAGVADGSVDGGNVINVDGSSLASINAVNQAAAQISSYGNWGRASDLFFSQQVQADFDNGLDPAFRVALNNVGDGGLKLGAPVVGIRTSHGNIKTNNDTFIFDEPRQMPFDVLFPAVATALTSLKPASVTAAATTGTTANKFTAARAGNYYYLVAGVSAAGQSDGRVTTQTAVAAGQKVTLTITASAGAQETGYAIYRGRLNGTNAPSDMRLIKRVAKAGATTTFVDENLDIPGTSKGYMLPMGPGADAISWRQLLPMMEFQLYPTNAPVLPWAQLLFGYLRMTKRRRVVVFKNILPSSSLWKPF
jgi:hypothetical protein